jgi:uncharacterized protein (TIGR02145 family)
MTITFCFGQVQPSLKLSQHKIIKGETVVLALTTYRGNIQWQQSIDMINWFDLNGRISPEISFVINSIFLVRAEIRDRNCDPVYTDTYQFIPITTPIVFTSNVSSITQVTAIGGGMITDDGGESVATRGVCWSTSQNPTIADFKTNDGVGTGIFASNLTGLTGNTTYYVRAYATNIVGTSYGDQISFKTNPVIPSLITNDISAITHVSAIAGGNIINDGGAIITARGSCWSTSQNPTTSDSKTTNGIGAGLFTSSLTGLSGNTTYYIRAYATNSAGTGYGDEKYFITKNGTGILHDSRDGQDYNIVLIGSQWWMANDLNFNSTYKSWKNPDSLITGRYYDGKTARAVCPSGWHLPSDSEWILLEQELGMDTGEVYNMGNRSSGNVGDKLKSIQRWTLRRFVGYSGFNALPNGTKTTFNHYAGYGNASYYWTSTEHDGSYSIYRSSIDNDSASLRNAYPQSFAMPVRCLKDYEGCPRQKPVAFFSTDSLFHSPNDNIKLDASKSWCDVSDQNFLKYRWDFDGNGDWDTELSINPEVNHLYNLAGIFTIILEVNDQYGGKDIFKETIQISNGNNHSSFTDPRDNKVYKTIIINGAIWMAENLNFENTVSYCYNNNFNNCAEYGRLYVYNSATDACPNGWHLPSDKEWKDLEIFLGMDSVESDFQTYRYSGEVGGKLKSRSHWEVLNRYSGVSGFNALPSGIFTGGNSFQSQGWDASFWTSSEKGLTEAYSRRFYNQSNALMRSPDNKSWGFSVRCIKDN